MEKVTFEGVSIEYGVKPNLKTEETILTVTYTVLRDNSLQVKKLTDYCTVGRSDAFILDANAQEVVEIINANVKPFTVGEKKMPNDGGLATVVKGKLAVNIEPTDNDITTKLNLLLGNDFKLHLSPAK